ncbi:MAG: glycosyltransferase [Desulfatiglans sp.]|jgi:glycosyltransferase involved in cell wall biosynthesis|nr:glycosyltransferase [Desulfatiglans sp.]
MNPGTNIDYSIIIPAYNEEDYLPHTLESIIKSMKAIRRLTGEIIVSDNNSTDRTAAIAEGYGARVAFEGHQQISKARNTGAKKALGRYLIFVDSDTLISPALLKKTLNTLASGRYSGGGASVEFDGHLPILVKCGLKAWLILSKTFKWACGAYIFCTSEAFMDTGGFDERYYASEEIHFSIALRRWGRKYGKRFIILEEPIISSSRKIKWYTIKEHLIMFLHMLRYLKPLQNRNACYKMWYQHPKKNQDHR